MAPEFRVRSSAGMENSTAKKHQALITARLRNHKLSSPGFERPADVVRWFGAVQAQEFHAAKWALALRMHTATNADLEDAFNRGEILRTHLLRPTWHFVTPEDIRWLLQLTAPGINRRCAAVYRDYELDPPLLKRSNRVLTKVLRNGNHLNRSEIRAMLKREGITADDTVRLTYILLRAELDGIICSGPRRGNQLTFALLEERVPPHGQLTGDEALVELTRRYFASHGPATLADFVWWSGLSTTDARRGIALLAREIETIKFGEAVYWISPAASTSSRSVKAHLLPAYDEYNVAYKDRQLVFDQDPISQITNAGAIGPTVIINGKIISTWKATVEKKLKINLGPSRALQEREEVLINEAAKRYAVFHGLQLN